ncbi:molybdate ABC transporter substrate-binding protein [Actinoplanes nipponensis]|uniref:molybdate ABC transporter substrate-binding protein n=1 Tax=Actinoplanes nipponensis TaxID=135950 RepID=UPI00194157FD|nr:substrate-binding domain-containing protein [Actinoplanes nipponensis]
MSSPQPATASPAAAAHRHQHDAGRAGPADPARSAEPEGALVVHADEQVRTAFGILVEKFEAAYPGTDVLVEFGPSARHAQHIVAGAAVDVLISGDAAATARVVSASGGRPSVIARNPLVIAVARRDGPVHSVADLRRTGVRVAVCAARTRCGDAARSLVDVHPAVTAADGPAAVAAVRAGTADAALVHRTDIVAARADLPAIDFPAAVQHADQYTVVRLGQDDNRTAADAFVAFTHSALAQRVLSDEGFSPAG